LASILQVAYYRGPLVTRARMLESAGHHVTSVLGNDEAFGLDAAVIVAVDSIVIGFSAAHPVRAAMIHGSRNIILIYRSSPCESTAPRASPRPMAARCPTIPRFGWRRSRVPSKKYQRKRQSAPLPGASKVSERPDVNVYAFASAALTITRHSQVNVDSPRFRE
jgi:hypothetical protein